MRTQNLLAKIKTIVKRTMTTKEKRCNDNCTLPPTRKLMPSQSHSHGYLGKFCAPVLLMNMMSHGLESLTSWGQLSWLSPFSASYLLTTIAEWETEKVLTLQLMFNQRENISVWSTLFFFSSLKHRTTWVDVRKDSCILARSNEKKRKQLLKASLITI